MPQMTKEQFSNTDWAGMEESKYQQYLAGKEVDGLHLGIVQRGQVPRLRTGATIGTKVTAVQVDPNSVLYEEMAKPSDPAFAVYRKNYADGNFWYWFGTFWKEMPKADRLTVLKEVVNQNGELLPNWNYLDIKETSQFNNLSVDRQNAMKTLLKDKMMKKGFTRWDKKVGDGMSEGAKLLPKIDALGKQEYGVGFRGDARDHAKLIEHDQGAFRPKIKTPFAINKYNLNATWNPFSDDDVKNNMYWREGQADNDLFTVVSVAKDFATSTKFPLIDDPGPDLKIYPNGATLKLRNPVSKNEYDQPATVSRMYVYMVTADEGYDTQSYQTKESSFPEIGVKGIAAEKFLARMEVIRIHYGATGDDGHVVYVADYNIHHANNHKLLYQKSDDTGVVSKFIDYMTSTYYGQFFQYNTIKSPTLLKVVACNLIPEYRINIYNRQLESLVKSKGH